VSDSCGVLLPSNTESASLKLQADPASSGTTSVVSVRPITESEMIKSESDSNFVDCESHFS
jgi:hypothetical protein